MISTRVLNIFTITVVVLASITCRHNPTSPTTAIDSTSHNFSVIRIDTLGGLFSSLYALDIIDQNDIWAAGMFTQLDSTGDILYNKNLAHWNGQSWKMYGIEIQGYGGQRDTVVQTLINIRAFNDSNIFVLSRFNSYARYDGSRWISSFVDPKIGYVQAMWGRSIDDIFFVGERGSASHWDGASFTKMPTALPNPPLLDVWGNENSVYAVGDPGSVDQGEKSVFLYCNGRGWSLVNECNVVTRSAPPTHQYIGSMASVYQKTAQDTLWLLAGTNGWAVCKVSSLSPFHAEEVHYIGNGFYPSVIRGTGDNDIYVAASRDGKFLHYNGSSWIQFSPPITARTGPFAVKGNLCVLGGEVSQMVGAAIVVMVRHN